MNAIRQGLSGAISEAVYCRHTVEMKKNNIAFTCRKHTHLCRECYWSHENAIRSNNWVQQGYKIQYQYTEIISMSIYLQQLVLIFKIPAIIVSKIY